MGHENLFLRHLGASDRRRLEPALRRVRLITDDVAAELESELHTVLLPMSCILSVVTMMRDGRTVETRTIGRESGFGLLHALGSRYCYERVEVQIGGEAWALPVEAMAQLAGDSREALRTIARFAQATLVQSSVAVACNALHSVERRFCRWLLLTQDRLQSDVLPLTQEHLSIMLAVQRTTVTAAATRFQESGAIRYSRGRIQVLDREALIRSSCECYEQIEDGVRRLIGDAPWAEAEARA